MKSWIKFWWLALMAVAALAAGLCLAACDDDDDNDDEEGDDDTSYFTPTPEPDDDDDTTPGDDDDDDDDDTDVDDDVTPDDDDDEDYTCNDVGQAIVNDCGWTMSDLDGNPLDAVGFAEWCDLCEEMWTGGKMSSPYWSCMAEAAIDMFCDIDHANDVCAAPADPGTGCGHIVFGIYECQVVFVFNEPYDNYYIPQMDMQEICGDLTDWPWDCMATCVEDYPACGDDFLTCLNAC